MTASTLTARAPTRPWRPLVTAATAAMAALLLVATLGGHTVLLPASALTMACLVGGWVIMLDPPSYRGTTLVLALGAVAVLVGGSLFAQDGLLWLSASVALVTLLAFVHQLARRDGRPRLVESISASVTGIVLLSSGASLLTVSTADSGRRAVVMVMAAVLAGSLADVGTRWTWGMVPCAVVAVGLGALAAVAVSAAMGAGGWALLLAIVVGGLSSGSSHAVRQVQSVLPRQVSRRAQVSGAAASVLAVGLFTHVADWLSVVLR